jgi:hypothetical protein
MSDSFINLSQTDFEQVKESLTDFLRSKEEFTDYDFSGSALTTLIDILAYNTAFFSTYTNFLANESFIDSAQKRDSLMSLARLVGYTPRSRISARAVLQITSTQDSIPAGTAFFGADTGYIFTTIDTTELSSNTGQITVYQNSAATTTKNTTYFNGKITVPETADVSNIRVFVGGEQFVKANRISALNANSKVFFIDPIYSGAYEVSFGDGTYGFPVPENSNVRVEYLTPDGINNANGEKLFSESGTTIITTSTVITPAFGGAERETAESIRTNAPSYFQAQNRAVTANDVAIIFKVDNPEVFDVTAWGGEDNNPPQYGRVFVSAIKDATGATFSASELSEFGAKLQEKMVVGVLPEFRNPSCYDINVPSGIIIYDSIVNSDGTGVRELVRNKINLNDPKCGFKAVFPYSNIVSELVVENDSIRSVDFDVNISSTFTKEDYEVDGIPIPRNIFISFANRLIPGSIFSNVFAIDPSLLEDDEEPVGFLDDDGNGFIRFGGYINSQKKVLNARIGTVNYQTGNITIQNLDGWDAGTQARLGSNLIIYAVPFSKAVRGIRQASYQLGTVTNTMMVTE